MPDRTFPRSAAPGPPPANPPGPTVLVVDDDPAVLGSLKFSLEIEGYRVRVFHSGVELLESRDLPPAACLVIDYNLGGVNGLDVVAELRRSGRAFPAILITSHPGPAVRARAGAAGMAIVEKPLLGNGLTEAIRVALTGQ